MSNFDGETDSGVIAAEWWYKWIRDDPENQGVRRAARARLRRARSPLEAIQVPEALQLVVRFSNHRHRDRAAVLAGILAHVEENEALPIARAIGLGSLDSDQRARMSEARFRRLLQFEALELLDPMRRLVRLADNKANVRDLSRSVLYWDDETRKRWIYYYYGVSVYPRQRLGVIDPLSEFPENRPMDLLP